MGLRLLAPSPRIVAFARYCNVESEAGNLRGASRSTQGTFYRRTPVGTRGSGEVLVTLNALGSAHGQIYSIAHALDHFSSPVLPTEYLCWPITLIGHAGK